MEAADDVAKVSLDRRQEGRRVRRVDLGETLWWRRASSSAQGLLGCREGTDLYRPAEDRHDALVVLGLGFRHERVAVPEGARDLGVECLRAVGDRAIDKIGGSILGDLLGDERSVSATSTLV